MSSPEQRDEAVPTEQAPKGQNERRFRISGDGTAHVRAPSGPAAMEFSAFRRAPTIALAKDPETTGPRPPACRCPTRSRMNYGVTEAQRSLQSVPVTRRKPGRAAAVVEAPRFRWCSQRAEPAMASGDGEGSYEILCRRRRHA